MKVVVIGGNGLIGTKVVSRLRQKGHEVVAASPNSGVNTITGEGLAEALAGAQVVVDLANSPSFEDQAVLEFFQTSGRNLLAAEAAAGVKHHVALSVVGSDRLPESGYLRAKMAQESLIKASKIPYTIVRSTQFFEFVNAITQSGTVGQTVRLSPAILQPIGSDDVADAVADVSLGAPLNGMMEIAGPERIPLAELARRYLRETKDPRQVVADVHARYFGTELNDQSLTPVIIRASARSASMIGSATHWRSDSPLPPKLGRKPTSSNTKDRRHEQALVFGCRCVPPRSLAWRHDRHPRGQTAQCRGFQPALLCPAYWCQSNKRRFCQGDAQ